MQYFYHILGDSLWVTIATMMITKQR